MHNYDTVSEAVNELIKRGYTANFLISTGKIFNPESGISLDPAVFVIDEFYRFEGDTDPGDEMIVYAISSPESGVKGVLVNAYGPYSDSVTDELIEKLKVH